MKCIHCFHKTFIMLAAAFSALWKVSSMICLIRWLLSDQEKKKKQHTIRSNYIPAQYWRLHANFCREKEIMTNTTEHFTCPCLSERDRNYLLLLFQNTEQIKSVRKLWKMNHSDEMSRS